VINGFVLVHCRVIPSFWEKTAQKRGITRQSVAKVAPTVPVGSGLMGAVVVCAVAVAGGMVAVLEVSGSDAQYAALPIAGLIWTIHLSREER